MSLSILSTFAAAISAVAVLVSLLLVQRQIRQSEKNQRALIQQGRASRSAEIAMRLMDSDFAEAYHFCMNGDTKISEIQLVQFIGYCRAVFLGAEDSFLQHRECLLDEPAFNSFKRALTGLFVSPGMRAGWTVLRELVRSRVRGLCGRDRRRRGRPVFRRSTGTMASRGFDGSRSQESRLKEKRGSIKLTPDPFVSRLDPEAALFGFSSRLGPLVFPIRAGDGRGHCSDCSSRT